MITRGEQLAQLVERRTLDCKKAILQSKSKKPNVYPSKFEFYCKKWY